MNTLEACKILGVNQGCDQDQVSKAFREKASKMHPDVNKEPNAEANFKKINEAYQLLKNNGTTPQQNPFDSFGVDFNDIFGGGIPFDPFQTLFSRVYRSGDYQRNQKVNINPLRAFISISFEESILGCEKEIIFNQNIPCAACGATGVINIEDSNNKCAYCSGTGKRIYNIGGTPLVCNKCKGAGKAFKRVVCGKCLGNRTVSGEQATTRISIPSGIFNGQSIHDQSQNLIITVSVENSREFKREGDDVISAINIDLLEALKGTAKKVRTIKGERTLKIRPRIKNGDTVQVSGFGVPPNGAHIFVVDVAYPEKLDEIIKVLENKQEEPDEIGDE